MGCDTGLKPIKSSKTRTENPANQHQMEEKSMNSCLVRREMPEFEMDAYDAVFILKFYRKCL